MNYNAKTLEDALDSYRANPKRLTYKFFNRGSQGESCEKRTCDQWFLDALIDDLGKYSVRLVALITDSESLSQTSELSADAAMAANNLFCVMKECRRLRCAPELFPSDLCREAFFHKLSCFSKTMMKLRNDLVTTGDLSEKADPRSKWESARHVDHSQNRPSTKLPEEFGVVPFWHRLNVGTNVWNKWLENRYFHQHRQSDARILQRLPPNGMRIVNRWFFMYTIVEASYAQANRIIRQVPKSHRELSAATGEIHELSRSLTASYFEEMRDVDMEFHGLAMREEVGGKISLEMISEAIKKMFKEEEIIETDRFMIAVFLRN